MTVKTIGSSGRDYATPALWFAACPANLVTAPDQWIGQCYNDSLFSSGSQFFNATGITTDATHYIQLTTGPGQSFADAAGVRSNALTWNQSNGVAFSCSAGYTVAFIVTNQADVSVSGLQIKTTSSGGTNRAIQQFNTGSIRGTFSDLILDVTHADGVVVMQDTTCLLTRCLIINRQSGTGDGATSSGAPIIGCTIIKPSNITAGGIGLTNSLPTTAVDNAIFGFSTCSTNTWTGSDYNATDLASIGTLGGTHNQTSVAYTTATFVQPSAASAPDYRNVAASALVGTGNTNANNTKDISNATRNATPDIGAWENVAAAAASGDGLLLGIGIALRSAGLGGLYAESSGMTRRRLGTLLKWAGLGALLPTLLLATQVF